jgi:hypothetical protein
MYLSLLPLYVGGSLLFQLPWAWILLLPVFFALEFGVIIPEGNILRRDSAKHTCGTSRRTYGFAYVVQPRLHDPPEGRLDRLRKRFAAFGVRVQEYMASLDRDDQVICSAMEWMESKDGTAVGWYWSAMLPVPARP